MKKIFVLLLIILTFGYYHAQEGHSTAIPQDVKVGLSLSGGGAKGFAHIGVLKVIDSLGIRIDHISGTSMGAIVGGLYASGYTGKDIENIVKNTDFYQIIANEKNRQEASVFTKINDKYLLSVPIVDGKFNVLPKAISTGQKNIYMLKDLLNNVSHISDFSQLPIPFMCVATNIEDGKMKIFENGDLISAIMSSAAYPGLMNPMKIGDSLYIDGAMSVNYPSKPLKDKGIDIVIGVDLSLPLSKKEELNSAFKIIDQIIDFNTKKENLNQYQYTDINIHPNLIGYSSTSYGDKEKILKIGHQEALKYIPILQSLPKRETTFARASINTIFTNVYKIDSLSVENNNIFGTEYIKGKMRLKIPSSQTFGNINTMIDKLYATNNYRLINYDLVLSNEKNILKLIVDEDKTRFFLKFGLHYDNIFKSGLLLNATMKRLLFQNSTLSVDVVAGDAPRYYFNYFMDNGYIPGFGVYSSGMTLKLMDNQENITENRRWIRNEIFVQSIWKDKFVIGGGISHDYFKAKIGMQRYDNERNFINPFVFINTDTRDDKDFATRGFYFDARGSAIDIFRDKNEAKNLQLKGNIQFNFPINQLFTYRLNLFGGFSLGDSISPYYHFYSGGIFEQNLGNFTSFQGYHFGSVSTENILSAGNDFQFRFKKNYFITGHFNLINTFDEHNAKNVFQIKDFSAGITAGYKSPFGQIKINASKAANRGKGIISIILGHWF